jgi:hypothetical protein
MAAKKTARKSTSSKGFHAFEAAWKRVGLPGRPVPKGKHAAVTAWGWHLVYDPMRAMRVLRRFPTVKRASAKAQERIAETLGAEQVVVEAHEVGTRGAARTSSDPPSHRSARYITDEEPTPFTMAEFLDANKGEGALDPADLAAIRALKPGQSVTLNFGAGGRSTITRVKPQGGHADLARYQVLVAKPGKLTPAEKRTLARLAPRFKGLERTDRPKVHLGHNLAILTNEELLQKLQKEARKIDETTGKERRRHQSHRLALRREIARRPGGPPAPQRIEEKGARDKRLAAEMAQRFPTHGAWSFDYMYPGLFTYTRDNATLFFTPDYDDDGKLSLQVADDEGASIEAWELPGWPTEAEETYPVPLTADYMHSFAVRCMDLIDAAKPGKPGTTCHHCKKPIAGIPVTHHSPGKPSKHYHPAHAHHHKA